MILYHGSNVAVTSPKLLKNQRELDFGKGFYTTTNLEQASRWAKRTALRLRHDEAFVSVYEVSEERMRALRILRFQQPDPHWLRFVVSNRKGNNSEDEWDVVYGPVANDQTMPVIDLYLDGMYTEEEAIRRLLPQKLHDQVTFKTAAAISLLNCTEVISL